MHQRIKEPKLLRTKIEYSGPRLNVKKKFVSESGLEYSVDVVDFPVRKSKAILALTSKGSIILERHYRHALEQEIYEIAAGWVKRAERPASAARRELMEETGFVAKQIKQIGRLFAAPGYSTEEIYFFFARTNEKPKRPQTLETGEKIGCQKFTVREVFEMVKYGRIRDAMTICALYLASEKNLLPHSSK